MVTKPYVIIGAGGHAKVICDLLLKCGYDVAYMTDSNQNRHGQNCLGVEIRGDDGLLGSIDPDSVYLALGLGVPANDMIDGLKRRVGVAQKFQDTGFCFPSLIHPSAIMGIDCNVESGAQIMAGSVIQPNTQIRSHAIVNSAAIIDHDCYIGKGSHIGPGVNMGGSVSVGEFTYVGIGSSIINNIEIDEQSIVAAGAVVTKNVEAGSKVAGVPAERMK